MRLDPDQCRRRAAGARFAVLATRAGDGSADLVPITFVLEHGPRGDRLSSAVDHKPKTTQRLARLANIEREPLVTVLFDHRDDDWDTLWWVRARGLATVREPGTAGALLAARYPQYRDRPPQGPVVEVRITAWSGWSAEG
jgi:PPOX class probable F420-dependent enzyme